MDTVSAQTQPRAGWLRVTKEERLPAVPAADVTPHKGKRRKETTSEDRRQEGCQSHDKGRTRRIAREVSTLQLWTHSHQRPELWTWLAGRGQWLCSWRVLAPLSPSFIPTPAVAGCISERTLSLIAQIDLKSCSACWQDLIKALRGKTRKIKGSCSLSGCTCLQKVTGCYPIKDFCSSKYFLGKVYNPCNISWWCLKMA